jgi:hypothetical protein
MDEMWKTVSGAVLALLGGILLMDIKTTREIDRKVAAHEATLAGQASDIVTLKAGREDQVDRLARIETQVAEVLRILQGGSNVG